MRGDVVDGRLLDGGHLEGQDLVAEQPTGARGERELESVVDATPLRDPAVDRRTGSRGDAVLDRKSVV